MKRVPAFSHWRKNMASKVSLLLVAYSSFSSPWWPIKTMDQSSSFMVCLSILLLILVSFIGKKLGVQGWFGLEIWPALWDWKGFHSANVGFYAGYQGHEALRDRIVSRNPRFAKNSHCPSTRYGIYPSLSKPRFCSLSAGMPGYYRYGSWGRSDGYCRACPVTLLPAVGIALVASCYFQNDANTCCTTCSPPYQPPLYSVGQTWKSLPHRQVQLEYC